MERKPSLLWHYSAFGVFLFFLLSPSLYMQPYSKRKGTVLQVIKAFLLLLETSREASFWRVSHSTGRHGRSPPLQCHSVAGGLSQHQADKRAPPEKARWAAGSWPPPSSFKGVAQSRDVFQTDTPPGALPRTRGGEQATSFSKPGCLLAAAQGLVGTNISCSRDPLYPLLTYRFPSERPKMV